MIEKPKSRRSPRNSLCALIESELVARRLRGLFRCRLNAVER